MNDLQRTLLEMAASFHQFCIDNDLTYFVIEGTMLGMARHSGFIPWDDDIDIGMPRKDYNKLSSLLKDRTLGKYVFECAQSRDDSYCYPYGKLYDTTTTMIESIRQELVRGVYLDIFPIDGIGKSVQETKKNFRRINFYNRILVLKRLKIESERKWYKNLLVAILKVPLFKRLNAKNLSIKVNELCQLFNLEDSKYGGNLLSAWGMNAIMPVSIIETPKLYKFENIELYGISNFDEYLSHLYGDWRKLPPENERVSHHDYYLDLKKPYKEYRSEQ